MGLRRRTERQLAADDGFSTPLTSAAPMAA